MNSNLTTRIALRIIVLFTVTILITYLPEFFPKSFFNDTPNTFEYTDTRGVDHVVDKGMNWGIRHIWYTIGVGCLFILSLIDSVMFVKGLIDKYYPSKD